MKTDVTQQPFETSEHDLAGFAAIDLRDGIDFNMLAAKLTDYDADRFDPVVLKIYMQGHQPVVTLYALDKSKQEQDNFPKDKLPVKKFKLQLSWPELLAHIKHFELVVSNNAYDIRDMLVTNK